MAIAIAHLIRIKVPLLFVYYDVPSYGYQDRIISFLSFGWSVFLFTASADTVKNRDAVRAILIAGIAAVFGLNVINSVTDLRALTPILPTGKPVALFTEQASLDLNPGFPAICHI